MKKYFNDYNDILFYALEKLDNEDEITILCDIDSMMEIKDFIDLDDYTEIKTKIDNDCEVYYISKFANNNGYSLFIEPAVYKGELLEQDSNLILVVDYIEGDYKLNGEYGNIEFLWLDENLEDDEDELDDYDHCVMEKLRDINGKLNKIIELLDKTTIFNISELKIPTEKDAQDVINSLKTLPKLIKTVR